MSNYNQEQGEFRQQRRRHRGNRSRNGFRGAQGAQDGRGFQGNSAPRQARPPKAKGPQFFNPEELCLSSRKAYQGEGQPPAQPSQPITHKFTDFHFAYEIEQNLTQSGYENPTPIQDQTIPQIMAGRDVIGLANTGTGKTAAFLLPLIHKVFVHLNSDKRQKVLIISPTRELAVQIKNEFEKFADNLGLKSVLLIGGSNLDRQVKKLASPQQHFVIGTPGRILDLANRRRLDLSSFQNIVLDEVDQMLDMGFIHDIKKIIAQLAPKRQSLFFSATMNKAAHEIAQTFLHEPLEINVRMEETTDHVEQSVVKLDGRTKSETLAEILAAENCQKTLIFARTKHGADKVVRNLAAQGFKVAAIHGNKTQNHRLHILDLFKNDELQILVATDVASRGLDIKNITHVINYDLPGSREDYIHRIGRTGRAEHRGKAISLVE